MQKKLHWLFRIGLILCCVIASFGITTTSLTAQTSITWQQLGDVTFEDKYIEEEDGYYWYPTFGKTPLAYDGKEVRITGYIIPVDIYNGFYVLSKYNNSACFFCGGGGPETILELDFKSKDKQKYKMDDFVTFKGTLVLNVDDIEHCNYILKDAVLVKDK